MSTKKKDNYLVEHLSTEETIIVYNNDKQVAQFHYSYITECDCCGEPLDEPYFHFDYLCDCDGHHSCEKNIKAILEKIPENVFISMIVNDIKELKV